MVETYPDASPLIEIMENTDNLSEEKSEELMARLEEEVGIIFESDYGRKRVLVALQSLKLTALQRFWHNLMSFVII